MCSIPSNAVTEPTLWASSVGRLVSRGRVYSSMKCCNDSRRVGQGLVIVACTVGYGRPTDYGLGVGDLSPPVLLNALTLKRNF
jgi:hypothetical protein